MSTLTASRKRKLEADQDNAADDDEDKENTTAAADEENDEAAEGDDDGEDDDPAEGDDDDEAAEDDEEEKSASYKRGKKSGRKAERTRINSIVNGKNAKGRESTALALALDSSVSVKSASSILAKAPKDANGGNLSTLMGQMGNAEVGADGGGGDHAVQSTASRMAAKFNK